jgi:hypothetical protein
VRLGSGIVADASFHIRSPMSSSANSPALFEALEFLYAVPRLVGNKEENSRGI